MTRPPIVIITFLLTSTLLIANTKTRIHFDESIYILGTRHDTFVANLHTLHLTLKSTPSDAVSVKAKARLWDIHGLALNAVQGGNVMVSVSPLTLDQASIHLHQDNNTWVLGKQVIPWGSASGFAPSNIFNGPSVFNPFGTTIGTSAILYRNHSDALSFFQVAYALPNPSGGGRQSTKFTHGKAAIQWVENRWNTDIHLGLSGDGFLAGLLPSLSLKGDIVNEELGYHLEAVSLLPKDRFTWAALTENADIAFGVDGSLSANIYWSSGLYFHNLKQSFQNRNADIQSVTAFPTGRYSSLQIGYRISDIDNGDILILHALDDGAAILVLGYTTEPYPKTNLRLASQIFTGRANNRFDSGPLSIKHLHQVQLKVFI